MGAASSRLAELAARLGHDFADPGLLREALTHSSATAPSDASYERLEFLGDRVLALVVADLLMARHPAASEGELARRHATLVSRDSLAAVARALGLADHIRVSPGESGAGTASQPSVLADVCEAVIGALYRDGGIEAARRFVATYWTPFTGGATPRDAKTALQEWALGRGKKLPLYQVVARAGPPHLPVFTVEVAVEGMTPAQGTGTSKRAAEQEAARLLLERADG